MKVGNFFNLPNPQPHACVGRFHNGVSKKPSRALMPLTMEMVRAEAMAPISAPRRW